MYVQLLFGVSVAFGFAGVPETQYSTPTSLALSADWPRS
jgi:hypothetical protein